MHLFTYGTLMDPEIMGEVAGGSFVAHAAVLRGYGRYGVRNQPYPGMVAEKDGVVEGIVYLDITTKAMERLDRFEGEMYCRRMVKVRGTSNGDTLEVFAYVVKPEHAHLLSPDPWDFQQFAQQGKQRFAEEYKGFDDLGR